MTIREFIDAANAAASNHRKRTAIIICDVIGFLMMIFLFIQALVHHGGFVQNPDWAMIGSWLIFQNLDWHYIAFAVVLYLSALLFVVATIADIRGWIVVKGPTVPKDYGCVLVMLVALCFFFTCFLAVVHPGASFSLPYYICMLVAMGFLDLAVFIESTVSLVGY